MRARGRPGAEEHIDALALAYDGRTWAPVPGQVRVRWHVRPTRIIRTASSGRRERPAARRADASPHPRGVRRAEAPRRARARPARSSLDGGELPSIILWGPAGTGKTTLATSSPTPSAPSSCTLSAVSSGVADARKVMEGAKGGLFRTVLFVDEVHRWSKAQQDVLLPAVEQGTVTLIGATTENPYFSLNTPLLSRCLLLRLEPLSAEDLEALLRRALADEERGPRRHAARRSSDDAARAPHHDQRRRRADGPDAVSRPPRWPSTPDGPQVITLDRRRRRRAAQGRSCTTGRATRTTTSSARSSSRSAAPIRTPRCSGWRGCSRRARTRASSCGG